MVTKPHAPRAPCAAEYCDPKYLSTMWYSSTRVPEYRTGTRVQVSETITSEIQCCAKVQKCDLSRCQLSPSDFDRARVFMGVRTGTTTHNAAVALAPAAAPLSEVKNVKTANHVYSFECCFFSVYSLLRVLCRRDGRARFVFRQCFPVAWEKVKDAR